MATGSEREKKEKKDTISLEEFYKAYFRTNNGCEENQFEQQGGKLDRKLRYYLYRKNKEIISSVNQE